MPHQAGENGVGQKGFGELQSAKRAKPSSDTLSSRGGAKGKFVSLEKLKDLLGPTSAQRYADNCLKLKPPGKWFKYNDMAEAWMYRYIEEYDDTARQKTFTMRSDQVLAPTMSQPALPAPESLAMLQDSNAQEARLSMM